MPLQLTSLRDNSFPLGIAAGIGVGFLLGISLRRYIFNRSPFLRSWSGNPTNASQIGSPLACKLLLVVRNDLKMGKGKVAAQCCHASILSYRQAEEKESALLNLWLMTGQKKVCVKVEDETEMMLVQSIAKEQGLLTSLVKDCGHTQVSSNTITVLAVGPGPTDLIDQVTGHLKLF